MPLDADVEIPKTLFHGTSKTKADEIKKTGLGGLEDKPTLTSDPLTAINWSLGKASNDHSLPVVIAIEPPPNSVRGGFKSDPDFFSLVPKTDQEIVSGEVNLSPDHILPQWRTNILLFIATLKQIASSRFR